MKVKIERIDEYKIYIMNELNKKIKDKKKIKVLSEIILEGFKDGINFNSGRLEVDI